MYKVGSYFIECIPAKDGDYGWRCIVRFSRKSDLLKGGAVPRVTKISPSTMENSLAAEREAVLWARQYVATEQALLEASFSS